MSEDKRNTHSIVIGVECSHRPEICIRCAYKISEQAMKSMCDEVASMLEGLQKRHPSDPAGVLITGINYLRSGQMVQGGGVIDAPKKGDSGSGPLRTE